MKKKRMTLEEYVQTRLNRGESRESIQADLLKDLEEGGSIFGELMEFLKPTFPDSVRRFKDEAKDIKG